MVHFNKQQLRWLVCLLGLLSSSATLAQYTVRGKVSDASGQALPGVNLAIKGTSIGSVTDATGSYQITTRQNGPATLVFSAVGFASRSVDVRDATTLNVSLTETINNLEEVVVTGLASSIKRSNLANAVSTISAQQLLGTTQIQTTDNALYGKLPGVNINTNGGAPGGGTSVQLRGISSLVGASQPLYIIDGVYINNNTNRSGRGSVTGASGT